VRNTSIVLGTILVLALASVSHAQRPAGITPEMIATALPLEGAPLAVPGPYKVESGPAFGSPGHVVYRPADLTPFPGKDTLPVMVWQDGEKYVDHEKPARLLWVLDNLTAQIGRERLTELQQICSFMAGLWRSC